MEKLAENDLTYFYLRHVVIVVTAVATISLPPVIDASYQVSLHLAEGFQRRRFRCEKLTDDRRHMTDDGRQVMAKAENRKNEN